MSKTLMKHPKVLDVDTDCGDGYIVTLRKGWAFDDAAVAAEDDPQGCNARHTAREETAQKMLAKIKRAQPCKCGRCT